MQSGKYIKPIKRELFPLHFEIQLLDFTKILLWGAGMRLNTKMLLGTGHIILIKEEMSLKICLMFLRESDENTVDLWIGFLYAIRKFHNNLIICFKIFLK
ncbi:LOW QUALITY PROTEIN: hypothetical protein HZS_1298 [Henneguya salminicola]|nr:LOW QUALITY PROTEIN: hypothetical protein HZS_1298 [Henneguya salminicola]